MIWCSTSSNEHEVARHDLDTGQIIFSFGKHQGTPVLEAPTSYLRWMLSASGCRFLPDDLLEIIKVEVELRKRGQPPVPEPPGAEWPDSRDRAGLIEFAAEAPAADVADYLTHLRETLRSTQALLAARAEQALRAKVEAAVRGEGELL